MFYLYIAPDFFMASQQVYFDMTIGGTPAGRVVIGLYGACASHLSCGFTSCLEIWAGPTIHINSNTLLPDAAAPFQLACLCCLATSAKHELINDTSPGTPFHFSSLHDQCACPTFTMDPPKYTFRSAYDFCTIFCPTCGVVFFCVLYVQATRMFLATCLRSVLKGLACICHHTPASVVLFDLSRDHFSADQARTCQRLLRTSGLCALARRVSGSRARVTDI